jgi:uncharacterized membrane protein
LLRRLRCRIAEGRSDAPDPVGQLARAAALAVVGVLVGSAAVFVDPRRAGGLDAALRSLGDGPGTTLLIVIAVGFAAYGAFCLVDAATRKA